MTSPIFVALSAFAEHDREPLRMLESSGFAFQLHRTGKRITTAELLAHGREAVAIVAGIEPYDADTLGRLPALRCISRCGIGVDSIDLDAARARGIVVLNTPDHPAAAVAELGLTMMLALCRNLPRQIARARQREWTRLEAHLLGSRRLGLVGFGRVGRRLAELLRPFGAEILVADPAITAVPSGVSRVELGRLLRECDIVSIHAARSADWPLVIGREEIAAMKPGAILINLARGGMLDEQALYEALASGRLAGAGLDVYAEEPYHGPLCELENVVLTPHSATLAVETRSAMERECVANVLRFLRGDLPANGRIV
ncbi:MAG: phosphoglycerate dehydrogenase [Acidobacteria bacterium]|nr:phosphoglycerate dehydrogenase [Acidobacteriota bacterium]